MGSLADYFKLHRYQGRWNLGDRVQGKWNGIPFRGTVGTDSVISEIEGPRVTVFSDLPILYEGKVHYVIIVKPNQLKIFK